MGKVINLEQWLSLFAGDAEAIIHERAEDGSNVIWGFHAMEPWHQRAIPIQEVLDTLRQGKVKKAPVRNDDGDWEAVIQKRRPGTNAVGVVTIIYRENQLFVKTVEEMFDD